MSNRREWKISERLQQHADAGVPEARFVASVLRARQNGAPQYGERFAAWLRSTGATDEQIAQTIERLS